MTQAKPLDGDLATGQFNLHESLWPGSNELWSLTLPGLDDIQVVTEGIGNLDDRKTKAVYFYLETEVRNIAFTNGAVRRRAMDLESFILNFRKIRLYRP